MFLTPTQPPINIAGAVSLAFLFDLDYFDDHAIIQYGIAIPERWLRATTARRAEFVAGRFAAREALARLGVNSAHIATKDDRAPLWPAGFTGSITHHDGYVAATVAAKDLLQSIGIDAASWLTASTYQEIKSLILTPYELALLGAFAMTDEETATLLFSAKESIYKCLHPLTGVFFDFRDAEIFAIDFTAQCFQFRLLKSLSADFPCGFSHTGLFACCPLRVLTATFLATRG